MAIAEFSNQSMPRRFAPAAEIDPGVRVLVHEQRRRSADVRVALEGDRRPPPGAPGLGGNRMCWRSDRRAGRGSSARSSDPTGTPGTPTRASSRATAAADGRRASRRSRRAGRSCRPGAAISPSSAKHWRTVRTPASSSAESIDDSSLFHSRAPVRMLTKWKNQPRSCWHARREEAQRRPRALDGRRRAAPSRDRRRCTGR